jgi:hypothetical protein
MIGICENICYRNVGSDGIRKWASARLTIKCPALSGNVGGSFSSRSMRRVLSGYHLPAGVRAALDRASARDPSQSQPPATLTTGRDDQPLCNLTFSFAICAHSMRVFAFSEPEGGEEK